MQLTKGATRLFHHLKFLTSREGAFKFQRTLAGIWNVTTRTIRRWLTELKSAGLLAAIHRRGRTSALYELDPEAEAKMSTRMSTRKPKNVHSKAFYPLRVSSECSEAPLARKSPGTAPTRRYEGMSPWELRAIAAKMWLAERAV